MDDFKTCSLHDDYHTGCIDCQHDMEEEILILKAENARMREAIDNVLRGFPSLNTDTFLDINRRMERTLKQALKGGE